MQKYHSRISEPLLYRTDLRVEVPIALTIADLAGAGTLKIPHLVEAILYRKLDRGSEG